MASVEEFRNKFSSIVSHGDQIFSLALARDVGVLDVLINASKPLTCKEIAEKKNLKARLVFFICCLLTVYISSFFIVPAFCFTNYSL